MPRHQPPNHRGPDAVAGIRQRQGEQRGEWGTALCTTCNLPIRFRVLDGEIVEVRSVCKHRRADAEMATSDGLGA